MRFSEDELTVIIRGHELRNEALRQRLVGTGVDLREPRVIECHFWTRSQADAGSLAAALIARGYEILAQRSAASDSDPSLWNIEVSIRQSIELTLSREFTDELARIAAKHSGRYDGWGTQI